jgi:hypothetical protein
MRARRSPRTALVWLGRKQASYSSGPMPVALFLLPPSEPDVQLFTASGSPVPPIDFRDCSRMNAWLLQPSALRMLPIQAFGDTCHLSPCERLSRSRDYYGDSVTMSISACRPSRLSIRPDLQRAITVSFRPVSGSLPAVHRREPLAVRGHGCRWRCLRLRCATEGRERATPGLGFDTVQSHLARRTCGPHDSTHLRACPL